VYFWHIFKSGFCEAMPMRESGWKDERACKGSESAF
jgi:hypothetical protein